MSQLQQKPPLLTSSTPLLPDINTMKKAILTEIGGVTEQDLNVMSSSQIEEFYKELAIGMMVEQTKNGYQTSDKNEIDIVNHNNGNGIQSSTQGKIQQNCRKQHEVDEKTININGLSYYKPKFIEENAYILANKKLMITFGPELKNIQDKRKAICSAYNSSMSEAIKSMKSQEIEDTYERLRLQENKKQLFLRTEFDVVQFCVYVQPIQIDEDCTFLQNQNSQKPSKVIQPKKNRLRKLNQTPSIQQDNVIQDQFFYELPKNTTDDIIQNQQSTRKDIKTQSKHPSSLKQTIKSAKNKQKIQTSAQTQKTKNQNNNKKTKTQITIISQVEYVEDHDEQEEEIELRAELRPRPIDIDQQLDNMPHKLNLQSFKMGLEVGSQPEPSVLLWIQKMKSLVSELQENYLNQFRANWTVIND